MRQEFRTVLGAFESLQQSQNVRNHKSTGNSGGIQTHDFLFTKYRCLNLLTTKLAQCPMPNDDRLSTFTSIKSWQTFYIDLEMNNLQKNK